VLLCALAKHGSQLEVLALNQYDASKRTWRALFSACPRLTELELSADDVEPVEGSVRLISACSELTRLTYSGFCSFSGKGIVALAKGCPKLVHLCLDSIGNFDNTAQGRFDGYVKRLASLLPALRVLSIQRFDLGTGAVEAIAEHCHSLEVLNIGSCYTAGETGRFTRLKEVHALAAGCPKLQDLNLRACTALSDAAVEELQKALPGLRIVHPEDGLEALSGSDAEDNSDRRSDGSSSESTAS